jgi:type I restriction enzyme S subunit
MQLTVDSGQLPVGWKIKYLDELCENLDSKRVPITKSSRKSGNIPYYGASGIVDYVADYIFDEDLLLVSEDGANLLARTYPIAFSITGKTWVNNHAHVLRFKEKITQSFLEYYLNSISLEPYVSGMAQPKLNQKSLNSIAIPFPPLPEQKRIVAILDEAFEGIDRAIANTEKNLANSRELFESYLNAIFTQKGDGWEEKKLEDICKEITVGHVGSMASKYKDSGIPFLRSQNILPFRIKLDNVVFIDNEFHSALKKSQLRPGDLAIVRTGYPGTAAVIPEEIGIVNCSDLVIVKPAENINPHYLCLFFNSIFGKTLVGSRLVGAAQKHFNITTAKKVLIPFPYLAEQNRLVTKMDELASETQRLETIYRQKIAVLNEFKQSILQKAFTGELTADTANQTTKAAQEVSAA